MTHDVIALVQQAPDVRAVVAGMVRAGEQLRVRGAGHGALIQLCDEDGRPLLSIEAPQRIGVAGEVERLLGAEYAKRVTVPFWWVEARSSDSAEGAAGLGRRFADELVRRLGGTVWEDSR